MKLFALAVATLGFVAVVTAPPGPPLLLAMTIFAAGGTALAAMVRS